MIAMSKPQISKILFVLCYLTGSEIQAHTPIEGDVWATTAPFFYRTNSKHPVSKKSPNLGLAIVAEGDVDYNGGVEIAMIFVDKTYISNAGDDTLAERIKRMHITTGYRHWFNPVVSAGLSFYSSYSMGDSQVILDDRSNGSDLRTSSRDITEYGFDFSLQWEFINRGNFAAIADARYSLSTSRKIHESADHYGVLLGVKYLIPKQRRDRGE